MKDLELLMMVGVDSVVAGGGFSGVSDAGGSINCLVLDPPMMVSAGGVAPGFVSQLKAPPWKETNPPASSRALTTAPSLSRKCGCFTATTPL
jgi:hypothetical protein